MTRLGKCDVCRLRKVKCDESKPFCEVCLKGGRPCSYGSLEDSESVSNASTRRECTDDNPPQSGLILKSTRTTASGHGRFQTFSARKSLSYKQNPCKALTDHASRVAWSWQRMETRMPPGFSPEEFPAMFHDSDVLAHAGAHLVDCHNLFLLRNEHAEAASDKSGVLAMKSLRQALSDADAYTSDSIMYSMRILLISEYLKGRLESNRFKYHAFAMIRMLKSRFMSDSRKKWGMFEENMAFVSCIEENIEALFADTPTELDDPRRWTARRAVIQLPAPATIPGLRLATSDNLYRLPRLVTMVRRLQKHPNNLKLYKDALQLAQSIYAKPAQMAQDGFPQNLVRHETTSNPVGYSIPYPNDFLYGTYTMYYFYRIQICGVIQRIFSAADRATDISIPCSVYDSFDRVAVEVEDVEAAEYLAMGIEFAMEQTNTPPFRALSMLMPNAVAYGTWNRLLHRSKGKDPASAAYAFNMREFVVQSQKRITDALNSKQYPREAFGPISDCYVGGPALPFLARRNKAPVPDPLEDPNWKFGLAR